LAGQVYRPELSQFNNALIYSKYEGQFKNDSFHGQGRLQEENGRVYEGSFNNGKKSGIGRLLDYEGKLIYQG